MRKVKKMGGGKGWWEREADERRENGGVRNKDLLERDFWLGKLLEERAGLDGGNWEGFGLVDFYWLKICFI